MHTVADLLSKNARLGLVLRAGPAGGRPISDVVAVESFAEIAGAVPGSLVVVMQAASIAAVPYELDVAVRQAADRELAALVLVGREQLPVTSTTLAERAGLPVLTVAGGRPIADLLLRIDRIIRGGAADSLSRASAAIEVVRDAEARGRVAELLAATSQALGRQLSYVDDDVPGASAGARGAVFVRGRAVGRVRTIRSDEATALVLPAVAAAVARLMEADLSRRFAPAQTRAELIAQILVAERQQLTLLAAQARELGLPIDETHVAAWIHIRAVVGHDPGQERRLVDFAELTALRMLPAGAGLWHVARTGGDVLILRTERRAPDDLSARVQAEVERLVGALQSPGDAVVYAGLGTPQQGAEGLQQTAQEARGAADSAEAGRRSGVVTVFDAHGLRRLLAELYASPFGSRLIAELLAPLDARGPVQSRRAIQTLAAFLDAQSSPTDAARALNMHPNTVTYRIKRIAADLQADLSDPSTRFALHLACRVRLIDQ